ncbi:MAG: hypothetical protein ACRDDH_11900 [Cetobacterium sp.]|uniref:hypothetical protein n=1 Tax=Cetobacterium sp. TaxID=2071632 RepID=UPI003EE48333
MKCAIITESSFTVKDMKLLEKIKERYPDMELMFREKTLESRMIPRAKFKTYHELKTYKKENKWQTLSRICRAANFTMFLRGSSKEDKSGIERNFKLLNIAKNYSRLIYLAEIKDGVLHVNQIKIK